MEDITSERFELLNEIIQDIENDMLHKSKDSQEYKVLYGLWCKYNLWADREMSNINRVNLTEYSGYGFNSSNTTYILSDADLNEIGIKIDEDIKELEDTYKEIDEDIELL